MDTQAVLKVARLARLRTTEEQAETLKGELEPILTWVETLSEVDTDDVEPMASPTVTEAPLRKDEVNDGDCADKVLKNAPEETQSFFVVPKVVE